MKRQWQVKRTVKESLDAQRRWDRAYLLILEITRSIEPGQEQPKAEVEHASSNICAGIDPTANPSANH